MRHSPGLVTSGSAVYRYRRFIVENHTSAAVFARWNKHLKEFINAIDPTGSPRSGERHASQIHL